MAKCRLLYQAIVKFDAKERVCENKNIICIQNVLNFDI